MDKKKKTPEEPTRGQEDETFAAEPENTPDLSEEEDISGTDETGGKDGSEESRRGRREKEKRIPHQVQKELDALNAQLAERNDQYLRLAAEYENYRKRTDREKGECYVSAYGDALKAFLPLLDGLAQALQFTPDDPGILALSKQVQDILAKLGITEMETDGVPFDPVYHNAVMHEDNPDAGENMVVQTFQKGYLLGERVLRPAMVKVAN